MYEKGICSLSTGFCRLVTVFVVLLFAFCISVSVYSCQRYSLEDYTTQEVWVISPKTEKSVIREFGEKEFECMVISRFSDFDAELFYLPLGRILGFDYEAGYEYKVSISVTHLANPPQDSSNEIYAVKQILSKDKVQ